MEFLGNKSNVWSACRKGVQSFIDSNNVSPNHSKEVFLNLHPQASMLRVDTNDIVSSPEDERFGGSVMEGVRDSSSPPNYNEARIKVFGVGGGGSNAVNRMLESSMKGVEFWILNTDVQAMKVSSVFPENRVQIGQQLTRGLGAGGNAVVGMNAANESKAGIEEAVYGADMVFVAVCLSS